jgi:hypothetical protein
MAQRLNVTVMYGENKLQKTISLPATATVAAAKKAGSVEITNHLRLQAGVPSDLSIDDECRLLPRYDPVAEHGFPCVLHY